MPSFGRKRCWGAGAMVGVFAVGLCLGACTGDPEVLSGFHSVMGVNGRFRERPHRGVDLRAAENERVHAADAGTVISINADLSVGYTVMIQHPQRRLCTVYAHLKSVAVREGQEVRRGDVVGVVGLFPRSAGVLHLHFGTILDPCIRAWSGWIDPMSLRPSCDQTAGTFLRPVGCGRDTIDRRHR